MRRPRLRVVAALVLTAILAACGATTPPPVVDPVPSGLCLEDLPEISNFSFDRLRGVTIEQRFVAEVVHFAFEPSDPGFISVTVQPAKPPWWSDATGEPIDIDGERHTSVRFEGLRGVGAGDRLVASPGDGARIREIVRIEDRNTVHWVLGTVAGTCLRLVVDEAAAFVSVHVSGP
jgi:hypothetical protein